MGEIKGIYAAGVSIFNKDLSLNVDKTIFHAEKLIHNGCHGAVVFGSTGQAQLISVQEKIQLINKLSKNKFYSKFIIGTGLNSLNETVNLLKISVSLKFEKFLVMPPAYYKYSDKEVIEFYEKVINNVPQAKIILYNFEKLSGYKFSENCVKTLVKNFPGKIVGLKDSSYNLYENLKIDNFSILPGSELKLLKGLENGCDGIITATCNVLAPLAREVYESFSGNKNYEINKKMCDVRKIFDRFNLISALHTYLSSEDDSFENVLPPCSLLDDEEKKILFEELEKVGFNKQDSEAA